MYFERKEKIICTIEARMTSTRLPGKVLLPLNGIPSLQFLVERIRRSEFIDDIVVATTLNDNDDLIVELCEKIQCKYFRGSELDVLQRVLTAAKKNNGNIIVEITGDCPFVDHRYIDKMIHLFYEDEYDYARMYGFPEGFGVQVFYTDVLEKVNLLTDDPVDRVHVTYYIYTHPEKFRITSWTAEGLMHWPEARVTLDEKADYELLNIIARELYPKNNDFSAEDVAMFLKRNKELMKINAHIRQKDPEEM